MEQMVTKMEQGKKIVTAVESDVWHSKPWLGMDPLILNKSYKKNATKEC